jgi:hypothetical protein
MGGPLIQAGIEYVESRRIFFEPPLSPLIILAAAASLPTPDGDPPSLTT